jgi:hypothetical protein
MKSWIWVGLAVALCGCGGSADTPPSSSKQDSSRTAEEAAPAQLLRLRVALLDEIPGLAPFLDEWGAIHGAKVEVEEVRDALDAGGEYSLVEVEGWQLGQWAASQRIRPVEGWRGWAEALPAAGSAIYREKLYGATWRGRSHGLVLPEGSAIPGQWAELARFSQDHGGLALQKDRSGLAPWPFLALSRAVGAHFVDPATGEIRVDPPGAVEALAFLARIHGRGKRLAGPEALAAHCEEGGVAAGWRALGGQWAPFPAPEGEKAVAWVEARVLCVPRGAPYFELASELAEELCAADAALPEGVDGWEWLGATPGSDFEVACLPAEPGWGKVLDLWSEALQAVMDRRREAEAALGEAQDRWMQEEMHER